MPNYSWKGRTRGGRVQEGVLVAESKDAAIASLRDGKLSSLCLAEGKSARYGEASISRDTIGNGFAQTQMP